MSKFQLKEIQDGNRLIAEFLGWKEQKDPTERFFGDWFNNYGNRQTEGVKKPLIFHSDWNWLMLVVEKIEEDERFDVDILQYGTIIQLNSNEYVIDNVAKISFDKKIEHTYDAIVKFIKWYNKNK